MKHHRVGPSIFAANKPHADFFQNPMRAHIIAVAKGHDRLEIKRLELVLKASLGGFCGEPLAAKRREQAIAHHDRHPFIEKSQPTFAHESAENLLMRREHAKAMLIPVAQQNIESLVSGDRARAPYFRIFITSGSP